MVKTEEKDYLFDNLRKYGPAKFENYYMGNHEVVMELSTHVWAPRRPTFQFLSVLSDPQIIRQSIRNKRVLDLGTGSGVIGIHAILNGAKYTLMTDINRAALELTLRNLAHNGLRSGDYQYGVADVDCFNDINEPQDTIFSNPPAQPTLNLAHLYDFAAKFNETLEGGRYVQNILIRSSRGHLKKNGNIYMVCQGRTGHDTTREMLDTYYGDENWFTLAEHEHAVDLAYLEPYMNYWIARQNEDGDIRVYSKDDQGRVVVPEVYDPEIAWYTKSYIIRAINRY